MSSTIYIADKIFTGENWLINHAVLEEDGKIKQLIPVSELVSTQAVKQYDGCILAPAFIDLQIYGAHGILFSLFQDEGSLKALVDHCAKGGTAFCLPTIATNTADIFYKCIDAVRSYWSHDGQGVLGLHIEGPWINPVRRGAHIESLVHAPTMEEVKDLLDHGTGVIRMITLAPEVCSREIIELIISHGIVVSAGHSDANYEEAKQGFAAGITAGTHLYNAMSSLHHRGPGLVGAIMDDARVMASIIPDGYHVDFPAIRIAKQVMKERLYVITDAVTETQEGPYPHISEGDKFEAGGILSGSALTMNKAMKNLIEFASVDPGEALRMCSLYPSRLMKLDSELGMIAPGYICRMVVLDGNMDVVQLI